MYEVTVKIGGNASKYWASLEFDDAKGEDSSKRDCQGAQRHEIKQYAAGAD